MSILRAERFESKSAIFRQLQFMNPTFRVFQRAFVLTIIAVPSCARLLRAEDALSGKFQTPRAFIAAPRRGTCPPSARSGPELGRNSSDPSQGKHGGAARREDICRLAPRGALAPSQVERVILTRLDR